MASCGSTQDAILTDQKFLDTICCADLGNQLHDLRVPISSITTNDQEASFDTFWDGEKDTSDKRLAVMWLLKDNDLLP